MYKANNDNKVGYKRKRYKLGTRLSLCNLEKRRDFRQTGQVVLIFNHLSTQSRWKQCWHSGIHFAISPAKYSAKHIGQLDSFLQAGRSRRLSPITIFVYDWIVNSSRPPPVPASAADSPAVCRCCRWMPSARKRNTIQSTNNMEGTTRHSVTIRTKRINWWVAIDSGIFS